MAAGLVVHTHPIILPKHVFVDRFGQHNSFVDTNPSLHIDADGSVTILVRRVDYRKYDGNRFTLLHAQSNSLYAILRGDVHPAMPLNIDTFSVDALCPDYGRVVYPTYWRGMEDIRFMNASDILVTVPELNSSGQPCIFKAQIHENNVRTFLDCAPSVTEKNWMPFLAADGSQRVVYSVHPFLVKSIFEAVFDSEYVCPDLSGYHGSTNGIQWRGCHEQLFLIHRGGGTEKTEHKWMLVDLETKKVSVSAPFFFFRHTYIEFPVSLAVLNERIFVSLGVNDDQAFILEISRAFVANQLKMS